LFCYCWIRFLFEECTRVHVGNFVYFFFRRCDVNLKLKFSPKKFSIFTLWLSRMRIFSHFHFQFLFFFGGEKNRKAFLIMFILIEEMSQDMKKVEVETKRNPYNNKNNVVKINFKANKRHKIIRETCYFESKFYLFFLCVFFILSFLRFSKFKISSSFFCRHSQRKSWVKFIFCAYVIWKFPTRKKTRRYMSIWLQWTIRLSLIHNFLKFLIRFVLDSQVNSKLIQKVRFYSSFTTFLFMLFYRMLCYLFVITQKEELKL
jgi:hypothetical protein